MCRPSKVVLSILGDLFGLTESKATLNVTPEWVLGFSHTGAAQGRRSVESVLRGDGGEVKEVVLEDIRKKHKIPGA